jgi:phage baseplate assembly protein W
MAESRFRAWQFILPGAEPPGASPGLQLSPTGRVEMVEEYVSVRQAIMLLLSTSTGERVMRPDYGCELHRLIFAPNDDTTAGLAIHYVRQALERWEPRVDILHLDADPNAEDPGRLDIFLEYRVLPARRTEQLTVALNLTGEST